MHLHTKEFGWCAKVWAKDIVDVYAAKGYSGICVTNHLFTEGMQSMAGNTWEERVDSWLSGYLAAQKQAEKYPGFDVILGAELRIDEGYEDFLLYGVTRELILEHPEICSFTQQECYEFAEKNKLVIIQAHPFRPFLQLKDLKYLHGIEVFNGNPRHDSKNSLALAVAQENQMIMVAGSDYHEIGDEATAAMVFPTRIPDSIHMAEALRSGNYELRKNPGC